MSRAPGEHDLGQSYSLEEAIEGRVSSLEVSLGHSTEGEQQLNVYSFLWNPAIAGVENFIMTSRQGSSSSSSTSRQGYPETSHHLPGGRRVRPVELGLAVRAEPGLPPWQRELVGLRAALGGRDAPHRRALHLEGLPDCQG